jgi:hypothetical protein
LRERIPEFVSDSSRLNFRHVSSILSRVYVAM